VIFQRAPGAPPLPSTPLHFIWYFFNRFRWWYVSAAVLELMESVCVMLLPYALGRIIAAITQVRAHDSPLVPGLISAMWVFVGLSCGDVLFSRAAGAFQVWIVPKQRHAVIQGLFGYLQYHSHRYFSSDFAGSLLSRLNETAYGVSQILSAVVFEFWPLGMTLLMSIAVLTTVNLQLAAFVGFWAASFILLSLWLAARCRPRAIAASSARSETSGRIVDALCNITVSRLFARLRFEREQLAGRLDSELHAVTRWAWYSERVRWVQFTAAAVLKTGVLCFALMLLNAGKISIADFVVACSVALLIIGEARNLSRRILDVFELFGNLANGVRTIVRPHEITDAPNAIAAAITEGRIEFLNVSFGYSSDRPLFHNLNVVIPAGQRVGLVGLSGAGKSTFLNLILRLYECQGGQVLIDDVDIRAVTQESLYAQIGFIPQDTSLFHRSLIDNIRYGRLEATEEEVIAAAREARAHEFILKTSHHYASWVGERGVKLSAGQRQRISIARVILKNARILLLDEATSSLDSITERAVQDTFELKTSTRTVIAVAHRLSTIAHLDRILVFDKGRVVEDGSHAELLARRGAYFQLWTRQASGVSLQTLMEVGAGGARFTGPRSSGAS
jgi:ATP-binding cassette subfamily B protein